MASMSMVTRNLYKSSSRLTSTSNTNTTTRIFSNPSRVTFPVRSFNRHASTNGGGDDSSIPSRRAGPYPYKNTGGSSTAFELKAIRGRLFVRLDMPGVAEDEAQVFVRDNTLFFKGEARKEAKKYKFDCPRIYLGSFDLCSPSHKIGDIKSEMKNGVLKMLVHSSNNNI